jgi:hypothetical protein
MSLVDSYIKVRERLLNWILRSHSNSSLNPVLNSDLKKHGVDINLAGEVKSSLNQFKASVMDQKGRFVDYHQLSQSPAFQAYCELVSQLARFDYRSLVSPTQRLSFWINLYNSLVIHGVVQEAIQYSLTESWLGILSFFQRKAYIIGGQRFSLTDIEHGVLRGNKGFPYFPGPHFPSDDPRLDSVIEDVDPRVHFALNCASNSCPPIGVYNPDSIDAQLDLASRNFIQGDLLIDKDSQTITISKMFLWYQIDFGGKDGIINFLLKHLGEQDTIAWLTANRAHIKIKYHPYDWGLNRLKSKKKSLDLPVISISRSP